KTAVFAPMPTASTASAVSVNPGVRRSMRHAWTASRARSLRIRVAGLPDGVSSKRFAVLRRAYEIHRDHRDQKGFSVSSVPSVVVFKNAPNVDLRPAPGLTVRP